MDISESKFKLYTELCLSSNLYVIVFSSRAPSGIQSASSASSATIPKKSRGGEEEEDLTQGMEDPPAEPRIVEVVATPTNPPITGQGNVTTGNSTLASTGSKKQDSELQPLKSGNLTDLDEQMEGIQRNLDNETWINNVI